MDAYQELRENRQAMAEFFASKGWELLYKWAEVQVKAKFEDAIRLTDPTERETARIEGLAIEKVIRLPFFLAEHAGLNGLAEGASVDSPQTTPEA